MQIVSWILNIVSLVCFILVVVKMFQNGQTGLGIASIVLFFCCGIGGLIAFIFGWIKSGEWGIRNIMIVWTIAILAGIIVGIVAGPPIDIQEFQKQLQQQQ